MSNKCILILPNQLFEENTLITDNSIVLLYEHPVYFTMYQYHKLKLILHRSTMKYYFDYLKQKYKKNNCQFHYVEYDEKLNKYLKKDNEVVMYDPVDFDAISFIKKLINKLKISLNIETSPLFLCSNNDITEYANIKDRKKERQYDFYVWQRKRLNVLMNINGKPVGGKWSYDEENRNKFPDDFKEEDITKHKWNKGKTQKYIDEAEKYVNKNFSDNLGETNLYLPISHDEAKKYFKIFLKKKLGCFGKYQDAIDENIKFGCHSVISPLLNIGLINIQYVLKKTLQYYEENKKEINLSSIEGFIRQIIGWREYVRYIYVTKHQQLIKTNFLNNTRKPSDMKSWFNATTNIYPIDVVIQKVLKYGYANHIERLMVVGNFMMLIQMKPKIVHDWFQMMFLDSYHVFMEPNVYGMSQFSTGSMMITKPYFSSSNYIFKMSNYKKKNDNYKIIKLTDTELYWYEIWDVLYYFFIYNNKKMLVKNYLTALYVNQWNKLEKAKQKYILDIAKEYLDY
jgi:deoxyribodipyrimidine photolyase-related protein